MAPVWFATAGAVALTVRRPPNSLKDLVGAAEPTFLVFVLALGVVVTAAGNHGLSSVVDSLIPQGASLPALLGVAAVSAVLANLVNNLPATLIIVAVVSASAPGGVLAMLIGVNVGPNLTYVGSLATLLWRRIVHAHDEDVDTREFLKLGALTVPASLVAATVGIVVGFAGLLMRALIWITESSWQACVDQARTLVPADADVTLLHVAASDVEYLAGHPGPGRLGRHRPPPPGPPVREIADSEAQALLERARERFGRDAQLSARRGRIEREVLEAAEGCDLLVLARDGEPRREPKSIGHYARFVVDHAGCPVLLVWSQPPPGHRADALAPAPAPLTAGQTLRSRPSDRAQSTVRRTVSRGSE